MEFSGYAHTVQAEFAGIAGGNLEVPVYTLPVLFRFNSR
jgi:hypothetical protein